MSPSKDIMATLSPPRMSWPLRHNYREVGCGVFRKDRRTAWSHRHGNLHLHRRLDHFLHPFGRFRHFVVHSRFNSSVDVRRRYRFAAASHKYRESQERRHKE